MKGHLYYTMETDLGCFRQTNCRVCVFVVEAHRPGGSGGGPGHIGGGPGHIGVGHNGG
jgi:hypothetical protein